jgi:hypothetical protein
MADIKGHRDERRSENRRRDPIMTLLTRFIAQWQRDAWNAVKPLTPGEAIGAAGAKAADLGLLQIPETWKPFVKPEEPK